MTNDELKALELNSLEIKLLKAFMEVPSSPLHDMRFFRAGYLGKHIGRTHQCVSVVARVLHDKGLISVTFNTVPFWNINNNGKMWLEIHTETHAGKE